MKALLIVSVITLSLAACNLVTDCTLSTEKGCANLQKLVLKNVPDDARVHTISFSTQNETSNTIAYIGVEYAKPDGTFYLKTISTTGLNKSGDGEVKTKDQVADDAAMYLTPLKEVDFSAIYKNINAALGKVDNRELELLNVEGFTIHMGRSFKEAEFEFTLNMQQKGASAKMEGRKMVYTVYPYNCSIKGNNILVVQQDAP